MKKFQKFMYVNKLLKNLSLIVESARNLVLKLKKKLL